MLFKIDVNTVCGFEDIFIYRTGDWSNGMIGVSKTFGGSSILSSPADWVSGLNSHSPLFYAVFRGFYMMGNHQKIKEK